MSNPTPASGDAAPKKKSKKKLIIIVAAAVVLLGGVGAYFMLGSGSGSTAKPKPKPGKVIPLEAITVNLAGGHYLKIHLALQATADAGETLDGSHALDLTVAQFSDQTMAELASTEGRGKAKERLLTAVEKAYEEKVMDIYFTEFVMQ
jgi:flagellar FliL protein